MAGIFISYRRDDSDGQAGRLHDALCSRFGTDRVFMDVVDLELGRWQDQIRAAIASSDVLLAVIGRGWVDARDDTGARRLDRENDFVRLEIELALQRPDVTVVPLLVRQAGLPRRDELPESLAPLRAQHAIRLDEDDWHHDVSRLLDRLQRHLEARGWTVPALGPGGDGEPQRRRSAEAGRDGERKGDADRGGEREAIADHDANERRETIADDGGDRDGLRIPDDGGGTVDPERRRVRRDRPEKPALAGVAAAALASVPAFLVAAQPLLDVLPRDELWEAVVRLGAFRAAFWGIVAAAVAGAVALAMHRGPVGPALRGLFIGAGVGLVAGGATALLREAERPEAAIFGGLLLIGAALGGWRVIGAPPAGAALGAMAGAAVAALLLTQGVVSDLFATQLIPAVLVVAGGWLPELVRPGTALRDAERPAAGSPSVRAS